MLNAGYGWLGFLFVWMQRKRDSGRTFSQVKVETSFCLFLPFVFFFFFFLSSRDWLLLSFGHLDMRSITYVVAVVVLLAIEI